MRIVVLSRSRFLHTTRWIVSAAKARGHDVRVAAPLECTPVLDHGHPRLLHRGKLPYSADVVIARPGAADWEHCLGVLRLLEAMGVPLLNGGEALEAARDRFQCAVGLARMAVDVPGAALAHQPAALPVLVEKLGGLPVLLSPAHRDGQAAWLETEAAVAAVAGLAWPPGARFVLQKLARPPRLMRMFVAAGEVAACVLARGPWPTEGGRPGEQADAPEAARSLAIRAVVGLGLGFGAVDLIETPAGPSVLDVDATPNLRGIHAAARKAILSAVIKRAEAMGVSRIPV